MFLALKELKHGKLRFAMIGFIIVLVAWLVFILSGLGNGLSTLSAATIKNMDADYVVFEEGSSSSFSKSMLSESISSDLKDQANVEEVAPFGSAMGAILKEGSDEGQDKTDVAILGISPGSFLEPKLIEGKPLDEKNQLGVIANDTLKEEGYTIGDTLTLDGSTEKFQIIGFVENETYNHLPVLFTTLDHWRLYNFAAPGSNNGIEDVVNAFVLQGPDIDAAELDENIDGIETATKGQAVKGMPGYTAETGTIYMMLAFLIVISAFIIAVFFYVLTIQKTNQFGVMKAIGASNGFIAKAIVSQVFILSLVSVLIGIALTYATAAIMPEGMPFDLDVTLVIVFGATLLVISVLSSLFSVRKITKIDPLTALGRVE